MISSVVEYEKMAEVEEELWWYRILHQLTFTAIENRYGKRRDIKVLDAGCGTGGLMVFLKHRGYNVIEGFDLSEDAVKKCEERGLVVKQGNIVDSDEVLKNQKFDVIISNDTLCYFDKEQARTIVGKLGSKLNPGGLLLFNIPALDAFKGMHDLAVGIVTRFESSNVPYLLNGSGLTKVSQRFWPFSLAPVIYFVRSSQRSKINKRREIKIESDVKMPPRLVNSILHGLISVEIRIFKSGPFGSSLFIVSKVTASD